MKEKTAIQRLTDDFNRIAIEAKTARLELKHKLDEILKEQTPA